MSHEKSLNELTLDELMQKAQEVQNNMKSVQNRLANADVTGVAGNQDVQIKISGKYRVISTTIADSAYANKEKLADLITIAINDAILKLEQIARG
jgi:DNA-binding YbaB/EbfC family protein